MDYFFRNDSDRESCMEAIEKRRSEKFIHISPVKKKTKNEVSYVAIKLAIVIIMHVVDICGF